MGHDPQIDGSFHARLEVDHGLIFDVPAHSGAWCALDGGWWLVLPFAWPSVVFHCDVMADRRRDACDHSMSAWDHLFFFFLGSTLVDPSGPLRRSAHRGAVTLGAAASSPTATPLTGGSGGVRVPLVGCCAVGARPRVQRTCWWRRARHQSAFFFRFQITACLVLEPLAVKDDPAG